MLLVETHPDRYCERMQITRDEAEETIYSHYRQGVHSWILMIRQTAQSAALCDQQSTRHTVLLASTPPAHIYTSNGTIKIFTSVVVGGRRRAGPVSGPFWNGRLPQTPGNPRGRGADGWRAFLRHSGVRSWLSLVSSS